MPVYRYVAINRSGKEEKGIINAASVKESRRQLRNRGLFVRTLSEDQEKRERQLFPSLAAKLYRIPRRNISLFVRQLGTLLQAGLPLDRSLENIIEQTENPYLKKAILEIRSDVIEGATLSAAMKKHPTVFPPVYHNLITIGEQTGTYEQALLRLADLEDASIKLKNKVTSALAYPLFLILLLGGIVIFLLAVVFPQMQQLFTQMDRELPILTKIVLQISDTITNVWKMMFIAAVLGIATYVFMDWKRSPGGRRKWETFLLTRPILGNFLRKVLLARFTRNLGVMLESKVPLIVSFQVVAKIVDHRIFEQEILDAVEQIKEGSRISEAFAGSLVMNQMVLGMFSAGEASDAVSEMVLKVADILDNDVDTAIQQMSVMIEPAMMLVMGTLIMGLMLSILLPTLSLSQQLQ